MTTTPRNVVLYARLSQQDGTSQSVPQQLAALRAECARRGWPVVAELTDDGISASAFTRKARPGWQELVRMVEAGQVEAVGFWEQSRLARDLGEYAKFRDSCASRGVLWITPSGIVDPSADADRLGSAVTAIVDEAASRQTSARVKRAMQASAEAGRLHGRSLYALERRYSPTRQLLSIEVVPEEAAILQRIAREVLHGASLRGIAGRLTDEGVPSPAVAVARRTGREMAQKWAIGDISHTDGAEGSQDYPTRIIDPGWQPRQIKRLMLNPAYAGRRVHRGQDVGPGQWEAILDEGTHRRLVAVLTDESRRTIRGRELAHFLSGVLMCGACEGRLSVVNRAHGGPSYMCLNRGCHKVAISKGPVEEAVRDLVLEAVRDKRFLKADDGRLTEIRSELATLAERLAEAESEALAGRLSMAALGRLEAAIEAQRAALEAESRALVLPVALPDPDTLAERWKDLDPHRKRHLTRLCLGDRIVLRSAGRKRIPPLERLGFPALDLAQAA